MSRPATPAQRPSIPLKSPPKRSSTPAQTPQQTANGEQAPQSPFQLDVARLHSLPSEQQDLYLLTFTSSLANHIDSLDPSDISAEQSALKKECFQIIALSQPAPTRLIRKNLARCFGGIFGKGNRKLLYESINDLVAMLNVSVKEKDLRAKHAAVVCLGAVFEAAGDSAMSLSALACTSALKLVKGAGNDTGLRAAILRALGRIQKGVKVALDEDVARSIWRLCRKSIDNDKALLVQKEACLCLEMLVRCTVWICTVQLGCCSSWSRASLQLSAMVPIAAPRSRISDVKALTAPVRTCFPGSGRSLTACG
jgi:HEAT repeat-containing protein 5